jgi:hypothetical protein
MTKSRFHKDTIAEWGGMQEAPAGGVSSALLKLNPDWINEIKTNLIAAQTAAAPIFAPVGVQGGGSLAQLGMRFRAAIGDALRVIDELPEFHDVPTDEIEDRKIAAQSDCVRTIDRQQRRTLTDMNKRNREMLKDHV